MKSKYLCACISTFILSVAGQIVSGSDSVNANEGPILDLEAFIVRENSAYNSGSIEPNSRAITGVFNSDMSVLEIPRSVTLVSPEHMRFLQIDDLRSLSKFGAGTQISNNYGVTGTPIIRGAKGSTMLNGMVRSFNLNEMPLSFGSSEALDLVKGPTPAHISPTHVGGYLNMIPKHPFFDERRGEVEVSAGSYDEYQTLIDYGGPMMIGSHPAAFRASVTLHREGGYYDRLRNDFESVYFSIKTDLTQKVTAFLGVEYFHYNSSENAGWNRPTQDLIDNGNYIVGEPVNIVDPEYQNTANRSLASFPSGYGWANGIQDFNALVVPSEIVDSAVTQGRISAQARDAMLNMGDADDVARAYGQPLPSTGSVDPSYSAAASVVDTLARLSANPNSGYRYTSDYFDLGGIVFTAPIEGNQVLSDENDHTEASNWVGFMDLDWTGSRGTNWQYKTLFDAIRTEKLSSYGYAIETEQFVFDQRFQGVDYLDWFEQTILSYGMGLRYTDAEMIQDYFAEPFSRRDVSRSEVSANSRILAGPQAGPDGMNYWSPDIGANVASELLQASLFSQADFSLSDRLNLLLSARVERAWFEAEMPSHVDRADDTIREELSQSGHKNTYNLGGYLTYRVTNGVHAYLAVQEGLSLDLTQAGGLFGEQNFAESNLLESGLKVSLLEERLHATVSGWEWEQSRFNERDFQSEPLKGKGIEFEATWTILPEQLYVIASAENQRIQRQTGLGFRSLPLDEQGWALNAGVINGGVDAYPENNPELNYPGTPETTYKGHLVWRSGPFKTAISGVYSRSHWLNFEQTLRLPSSFLVQLYMGYHWESWDFTVTVENLTDEDHFLGSDALFASNTLVTKGEPRKFSFKIKKSF